MNRLLLLVLLGAALLLPAAAETTEILATGPRIARGLPYLPPNAIEYYEVIYRAATGAAGGKPQDRPPAAGGPAVLYTHTAVVPPASWPAASCAGLLRAADSPPAYLYRSPDGWCLFFLFPSGYAAPCAFVTTFLERFSYFLGITQNSALSSFPAVLQLR